MVDTSPRKRKKLFLKIKFKNQVAKTSENNFFFHYLLTQGS